MIDNSSFKQQQKAVQNKSKPLNNPPLIYYSPVSVKSTYGHSHNKRFQSPEKQGTFYQSSIVKIRKMISQSLVTDAIELINVNLNKMKLSQFAPNLNSEQDLNRNSQYFHQQSRIHLLFCLATCYLSLKKYSQSLQVLLQIQNLNQNFQINQIPLLIAICYRSLNNHPKALQVINESLTYFAIYNDFNPSQYLFLKGTILKNLGDLGEAQIAFQEILKKQAHHQHCERQLLKIYCQLQNYQNANNLVLKALQNKNINPNYKKYLVHKLIEFLYKTQQYKVCLQSLDQVQQESQQKWAKLQFMKGKVFLKLVKYQDAIISFNQVLQSNSDPHYVKLSLIQLIIYFLKQRDYYEASLYARRRTYLFSSSVSELEHLSLMTEGLILLMKKNFKDGLRLLENVSKNLTTQLDFRISVQKEDQEFIKNLLLNGEGYALFSLGKYNQALAKYDNLIITQQDEQFLGCNYNKQIILGILSYIVDQNQVKSVQHFQTALEFIMRPEPYFYMAVILAKDYKKNENAIQNILSFLSKGIGISENGDMLYYRALIYMEQGLNLQAMENLQKAIEISQDNILQHFYAKGMVFFLEENFEEAIGELDIALSIDEKHCYCYLQKSKCLLFLGNYDEAYFNLKKYRQLCNDKIPWELYFMLHQEKYWQTLKLIQKDQYGGQKNINEVSFSDIDGIDQRDVNGVGGRDTDKKLYNKDAVNEIKQIKEICNFYLGRFEQSGSGGKLILGMMHGGYEQILMLLQQAIQLRVNVGAIPYQQMGYLKGYVLFKMDKYSEALILFQQIERQLSNGEVPLPAEEIELRLLIVKMNIFYCLYCIRQVKNSLNKLAVLIADVNEGPILQQLKFIHQSITLSQIQLNQSNQHPQRQNLQCQKQLYSISILENNNLLSHYFPTDCHSNLTFKIFIPFPSLHIPHLLPNSHGLLQQFTIKSIQNKPEPPWIKRGHFGLIFTNDIKSCNNLHIHTEQNDHSKIHDLSVQYQLQKIQ